ncbi:MAG: phage tail protein [Deltaproteobacteria bacterium]|nr:phage tail protein [Deltaproteobacteria bacterium]MCB9785925.1 phage tail protein [Deltaproteobacteria bacterium]
MPNRRGHDHIGNFNFMVEIEGVSTAAFKNVEGLDSETEIVEYQDGDDIILRKRPGRTKYSNITLKRGYINTTELWDWRKKVIEGKIERKSGSIILLADDASEIMRYNFFEAWPSKWKGFTLDGKGTDVNVEEIELAVERIERG